MSVLRLSRILILLTILLIVAVSQWRGAARLNDWQRPLYLTLYPLLPETEAGEAAYVTSLKADDFRDIGRFLAREARRYGLAEAAGTEVRLAAPSRRLPPPLPAGDNPFAVGFWSLRMRWWAWRRDAEDGLPPGDVQMFVQYRSVQGPPTLDRSVGVRKGRYTVVNAFASRAMHTRNNVVIAHELMHVLGATDKYDPATNFPLLPQGLAEPHRQPRYPQRFAEIMAGKLVLAPTEARMASLLDECRIGVDTAREIGWLADP